MTLLQITRRLFYKLFFIIALFLIFNTCTENKPTAPEEKNNDLATATIGINGGELKTDDFSLTVPAGSFQSETTLSLSTSESESPFGESSVTSIYKVIGIPNEFNNSIRIAVKYDGVLSDSNYIAIGEPLSASNIEDFYFLIPASDSSGYLVSKLIVEDYSSNFLFKNNSISSELEDAVIGITGEGTIASAFLTIKYPKYLSTHSVSTLAKNLDSTIYKFGKDHLELINLEYFLIHPSSVLIRDYGDYIITRKNSKFNIDVDLLGASRLKLAKIKFAGSFLNHIIYNDFDSENYLSLIDMTNALILYLESYLNYSDDNDPPTGIGGEPTEIEGGELQGLVGNELSLFNGFSLGNYPGLTSLIKYLVDFKSYKTSNLGLVFNETHLNNKNHYYSLIAKVDGFILDWFPDYYEKYIKGEVYNIDGSVFINQPGDFLQTWDIDSATDTSKIFTVDYNDLSAKRFFIELNHEFEDESANLILDAYPSNAANNYGVAILVFSVDANDNLEHLATRRAEQIEIQNLKRFHQNGTKKFLVVVVNCINNGVDYTGITEIDLKAKIKRKGNTSTIEGYYLCRITSHALYDLLMEKTGSDGSLETETYSSIDIGFEAIIYGDVKNSSFIGNYEEGVISSSVDIRFDNNYENIESISLTHTIENNNEVGNFYYSINAANIPKADWSEGIDCSIIGSNYCNSLQMANYSKSVTYSDGGVTYTKTTTTQGFYCNDMSGINVIFYKQ